MRISCFMPFIGKKPCTNRLLYDLEITMLSSGSAVPSVSANTPSARYRLSERPESAGLWGNFSSQKCQMIEIPVGHSCSSKKKKPSTQTILWRSDQHAGDARQMEILKQIETTRCGLVCWPSIRMSSLHGQSILRLVSCMS